MQETKPVRAGEELDIERLSGYLAREMPLPSSDIVVEQFPAGSSNLTYLVQIGDEEYVLRRPPFGNTVKSAHDMSREFNVLSKLSAVYPPAPKPLLFCNDESVIGSEFYLMERRKGLIIRGSVSSPHVSKGITVLIKIQRVEVKISSAICSLNRSLLTCGLPTILPTSKSLKAHITRRLT